MNNTVTLYTRVIIVAGVLIAGAISCSKNAGPDRTGSVEPAFSITAAGFENGENNTWSSSYKAGIYMINHGSPLTPQNIVGGFENIPYSISSDGKMSPVSVDNKITMPEDGTYDFIAYYPWKHGAEGDKEDRISGDLYPVDISDQTDFPAIDLLWGKATEGYGKSSSAVSFELRHALAQLRIEIVRGAGMAENDMAGIDVTLDNVYHSGYFSLRNGKLTYTGQPGQIEPKKLENEEAFVAIMLPSTDVPQSNRTATVNVPFLGKTFAWDIPEDYDLSAGKCSVTKIEVDRDGIRVVSNEISDWTGSDGIPDYESDYAASLALPNSYIVEAGSAVEIPVAKAYAVWNTNTLLTSSGASIPKELKPQIVWQDYYYEDVNYQKKVMIVSDEQLSLSGSGEDAKIIVPVPAEVVTDGVAVPVRGNIIVGLCDLSGKYLWSWHLWITDYDPNSAGNQYTSNGFTFMSRNLGDVTDGPFTGYCAPCLYQWGRKDALAGNNWSEYAWMAGYVFNGIGKRQTSSFPTSKGSANAAANLVSSIQNPLKGLNKASGTTVSDWLSGTKGAIPDRWNNEDGSKSAFDPCPEGWRVPVSGTEQNSPWYGLEMRSWNSGIQTENAFYPAVGYFSSTMQSDSKKHGYYWSATMNKESGKPFCLDFTQSSIKPSSEKEAYLAFPVRCVKE